ncbi:hypothetical protein ABQF35_28080 [Mycobacterium syngnathidarum]
MPTIITDSSTTNASPPGANHTAAVVIGILYAALVIAGLTLSCVGLRGPGSVSAQPSTAAVGTCAGLPLPAALHQNDAPPDNFAR